MNTMIAWKKLISGENALSITLARIKLGSLSTLGDHRVRLVH